MNEKEKNTYDVNEHKVEEDYIHEVSSHKLKEENDNLENVENGSESNQETPKKIEVITGNGELTISPVYEHLDVEKPKPKENRKIFIPEVKGNPTQARKNNIENSANEDN